MIVNNPWVGYITRTFRQIKDTVIARLPTNVPEITDHNESNPYIMFISVWSGVAEMVGYYIDRQAEERFLSTCKRFDSAIKISRGFDYRARGVIPATVELTFAINVVAGTDIDIPIGTVVSTSGDIRYVTTTAGTITAGMLSVKVDASQVTAVTGLNVGQSDGSARQTFPLAANVADNSISVVVGATNFLPVETFGFSTPTSQVFKAGLNESQVMEVEFGDGVTGEIPNSGDDVLVSYNVSVGETGNVAPNRITIIISSITVPGGVVLTVTNESAATGGGRAQNLEDLKRLIPLSVRTKDRAVTLQDYEDVATLAPGVARAGVEFDCGKNVEIYIVPTGGGTAPAGLLTSVGTYMDTRKMITTNLLILPAGEVEVIIEAQISALPNFQNSVVEQNVKDALTTFGSSENQDIRGSIVIGDIYQTMENSEGVINTSLTNINTRPFARPLGMTTEVLNWTRTVKSDSEDRVKWDIRFTGTNTFDVVRADSFLGSFSTGVTIEFDELTMNIIGTYTIGNQYEFYTYPFNKSIFLSEPSIPVISEANITLTVLGGIV